MAGVYDVAGVPCSGSNIARLCSRTQATPSYLTPPGTGAKGNSDGVLDFPFSTASWFFLDAVDMMGPADTKVVVALGDSIIDGTATTMNGDDRWPDVLLPRARRRREYSTKPIRPYP